MGKSNEQQRASRALLLSSPAFVFTIAVFISYLLFDPTVTLQKRSQEVIENFAMLLSLIALPAPIVAAIVASAKSESAAAPDRNWLVFVILSAVLLSLIGCGWSLSKLLH